METTVKTLSNARDFYPTTELSESPQQTTLSSWLWFLVRSLRDLELGAEEARVTAQLEDPVTAERLRRFRLGLLRGEAFLLKASLDIQAAHHD